MKSLKLIIYLQISDIPDVKVYFVLFQQFIVKITSNCFLNLACHHPTITKPIFPDVASRLCLAHYFHFPLQGTTFSFSVLTVFHASLQL